MSREIMYTLYTYNRCWFLYRWCLHRRKSIAFFARNPSWTEREADFHLHPCVRVSACLQFSRQSFSGWRRNYRRGRARRRRASLLLLRHVSPRRHFPLPANWTITLTARTSGARSLARSTYFLAHFPYLGNPSSHYVPSPLVLSSSLLFFSLFYICVCINSSHVLARISKCYAVVKTTNSGGKLLVIDVCRSRGQLP